MISGEEPIRISGDLLNIERPYFFSSKRIYPRDVVEKAVNQANETLNRRLLFGTLGRPNSATDVVNIAEISHIVEELVIKDDRVTATVRVLEITRNGAIIKELLKNGVSLCPVPRMVGTIDDDPYFPKVTNLLILAVDLIDINDNTVA